MYKLKFNIYLFCIPVFIGLISILASCRKDYAEYPYNDIEQFTLTDVSGNPIKAVVSRDMIRVYWPPFQTKPDSITPKITLSDRAGINPASGTKVSFSGTTKYTVTAQNGTKKIFKLLPMINQPAPVFEVSNPGFLTLGNYLTLNGQYFITDTTQTHLYLRDVNKKDIPVSLKDAISFMSVMINAKIPADGSIDTGRYQIKLVSGSNTAINGPYRIGIPTISDLAATYTFNEAGKVLNPGTEISFAYVMPKIGLKYYGGKYTTAGIRLIPKNGSAAVIYMAQVSSQNDVLLKFRLPDNIPAGTITRIRISAANGTASTLMYNWTPPISIVTTIAP